MWITQNRYSCIRSMIWKIKQICYLSMWFVIVYFTWLDYKIILFCFIIIYRLEKGWFYWFKWSPANVFLGVWWSVRSTYLPKRFHRFTDLPFIVIFFNEVLSIDRVADEYVYAVEHLSAVQQSNDVYDLKSLKVYRGYHDAITSKSLFIYSNHGFWWG